MSVLSLCVWVCVFICGTVCCSCSRSVFSCIQCPIQLSFKVAIRAASMSGRHWPIGACNVPMYNGNSWDWTRKRKDHEQKQCVSKETYCRPLNSKTNISETQIQKSHIQIKRKREGIEFMGVRKMKREKWV